MPKTNKEVSNDTQRPERMRWLGGDNYQANREIQHSKTCSIWLPLDRTCDCGAIRIARGDDTQVKQEPEKMVSEAASIVHYCAQSDIPFPQRQGYVESALATVRREAFKEAAALIAVLPSRGTMNYRRGYEEGIRDALRTLEASANSEKREGNG